MNSNLFVNNYVIKSLKVILLLIILVPARGLSRNMLTPEIYLKLKKVSSAEISPDGNWIAFTVSVPRTASDKPGRAYSELHLMNVKSGEAKSLVTGKVRVTSLQWNPDGKEIAFLMKKDSDSKTQVWKILQAGGEAKQVTWAPSGILKYRWHPSGKKIAFTYVPPKSERETELEKMGYGFIFFEENLRHKTLFISDVVSNNEDYKPEQLTENVSVWSFVFSPDGSRIAAGTTEKNLIDYSYAFQYVSLIDLKSKRLTKLTDNQGKLGNYAFSPDGKSFAYTAALSQKDNAVSQVYVMLVSGGDAVNLTPPDFRGHVEKVYWKDDNTIVYLSGEGIYPTLRSVNIDGGERKIVLNSEDNGVVFSSVSAANGFTQVAFEGSTPELPGELYYWEQGGSPRQLTTLNPELKEIELGRQEAIQYNARDGVEVEGLLIYPVGYEEGNTYPLVVIVHGGPESHYSNEWLTSYSRPGQILAGKGYAVFYPNYRASTGYGVEYASYGYNDAAGVEFDDIADGIVHLIEQGIADKDRVGLGGGSYGGYASAWFASYYTRYVKAVCMFVGISDLISKRGTTDIPYEELFVHSGKKLEDMWQQSLKRSPIYYAHQSTTAVLIYGGTDDPRVHPSQSLEFYRRLKMNGHPAVRLVQYPGEVHGNRKQTGQIDVLYRIIDWYDWYVKDARPLRGPMPPLDISHKYGLDLPD